MNKDPCHKKLLIKHKYKYDTQCLFCSNYTFTRLKNICKICFPQLGTLMFEQPDVFKSYLIKLIRGHSLKKCKKFVSKHFYIKTHSGHVKRVKLIVVQYDMHNVLTIDANTRDPFNVYISINKNKCFDIVELNETNV